jgi:hypothetical protein
MLTLTWGVKADNEALLPFFLFFLIVILFLVQVSVEFSLYVSVRVDVDITTVRGVCVQ